ncbi:MAG: hypothetical protein M0Q91_05220 [Methanoregula sp.]|jgi:hypothetical protein|nr:hypothetical protein [Methanoregula sp.]
MSEYGNFETAVQDLCKVKQSYPNLKEVKIVELHDGNFKSTGWKIQYFVAKKQSGHISAWWDW